MVGNPTVAPRTPVPVTISKDAEATAVPWGSYCSQPWQTGPRMRLWVSFFPAGDSCLSLTSCSSLRFPAMRTVYCMNEAEVVDVALGILIEVQSTVFYFCKFYLCIYFGRAGSSLLLGDRGLLSGCGERVSHCGGFSCCGARAPHGLPWASVAGTARAQELWFLGPVIVACGPWIVQASVVVAHGLSCPEACGVFPDQGLNPYLLH